MTLKTVMEQTQQAAYWMNAAIEADTQKQTNPRKRKDGTTEWANAAYNLSNILGTQISGEDVKMTYYSK